MLQYERIGISEGIDLNKSDKLVEYMICQDWYLQILDLNINDTFVMDVMIYQWLFNH